MKNAVVFNSSFDKDINITSEFYDKVTEGNNTYYYVNVNKISSRNYNNFFYIFDSLEYFSSIGIDNIDDYDIVYCPNFNFSLKKCLVQWKQANILYYNKNKNLNIYSFSDENAEAFALLKTTGLNCTNVDVLEDYLDDLNCSKTNFGTVKFIGKVNIKNLKQNPGALKKYIKFENNKIKINTDALY